MQLLFFIGLHNAAVMAILAILVWSATRIWKSAPAARLLWLLVLVKLIAPPVYYFDVSQWTAFTAGAAKPAEAPHSIDLQRSVRTVHVGRAQPESRSPSPSEPLPPQEAVQFSTAHDVVPGQPAEPPQPRLTAPSWGMLRLAMVWTWLVVAVLFATVAGIRIVRFRRMLSSLLPAARRLQLAADDLAKRMGLKEAAEVLQAESAVAPFVWCFGPRPAIVVSRKLLEALDERQLEMVLAHELAHLRRRDHWVRVAESAVSILYWWNPVVSWVRRHLRAAEEECCDAWVAWLFPDENRLYAESLLKSAEAVWCPSLVLSSPFLNPHTLKARVELVLSNRSQRRATRLAVACMGLFAVATLPTGISAVRGNVERQTKADEKPREVSLPNEAAITSDSARRKESDSSGASDGNQSRSARAQNAGNEQAVSKEPQTLDGTWAVSRCETEAAALRISYPEQRWRWTIRGSEIVWGREGQQWKLAARIGPSASPRQIDLTFLDGPYKGENCLGIYEWTGKDGRNLGIRMQDPGARAGRPTGLAMPAGSQTSLIVLRRIVPIDPEQELASFQGTWCFHVQQLWDWPAPIGIGNDGKGRGSEKRWVVNGNRITWMSREGERITVSFTINPFKTPKEIDFTFLSGPHQGARSLGIYEPQMGNDRYRWLCMTNPASDAPRPIDVTASSGKQQTMIGIYPVAAREKPSLANPLERFQGTFVMELCDSVNQTLDDRQEEVLRWRWVVRGNEILWGRRGDEWKLKLKVDPSKTPKEIDLTYLSGPFKGETCLGMYEWGGIDGKSLLIAIQDPGAKVPRPTEIRMTGDSKTSLIFLRPTAQTDAENEMASLQGMWTLRNLDAGSWPVPGGKGPDHLGEGSELRWTVRGKEISWTAPSGEAVKASFTIDSSKMPKHIDLKFLNGPNKGEVCPGLYQRGDLDENILWICIADPRSHVARPTNFSYERGGGRSLLSLYPYRPAGTR